MEDTYDRTPDKGGGGIENNSKIIFLSFQCKHMLYPSFEPSRRDGSNDVLQHKF